MKDRLLFPVKRNEKYGFFELADQYRKQMQDFYQDEYYQEERAAYQKKEYDKLDMDHKRFFFGQKLHVSEKWGGTRRIPVVSSI